MTKILLIGHTPPVYTPDVKIEAAHYRTWQFLAPLLEAGHQVRLCSERPIQTPPPAHGSPPANFSHSVIPFGTLGWKGRLQRAHDEFQPDCIVAVNFDRCLAATRLKTSRPIWMDIYGDYLTIVQVARHRAGSGRGIPTSIAFVRQVLETGDKFSACGTPQQHALTGELAMAGRLNHLTFGYPLVEVILPGAPPWNGMGPQERPSRDLSHLGIRDGDFVVLWAGGYNTWTDVDTLFTGLQGAMAQEERLHFVSLGANTYAARDNVYAHFLDKIAGSPYQERFHLLGWRPWQEVPTYYQACDVGLNIDALHYETLYGTRTRLVEMIAAGLPVITTRGSELSDLLAEKQAALTFEVGSADQLRELLLDLARDAGRGQRLSQAGLAFARQALAFSATLKPLCDWVQEPVAAPDRSATGLRERVRQVEYQGRAWLRLLLWHIAGLDK